jgi:hypothetical protein
MQNFDGGAHVAVVPLAPSDGCRELCTLSCAGKEPVRPLCPAGGESHLGCLARVLWSGATPQGIFEAALQSGVVTGSVAGE